VSNKKTGQRLTYKINTFKLFKNSRIATSSFTLFSHRIRSSCLLFERSVSYFRLRDILLSKVAVSIWRIISLS